MTTFSDWQATRSYDETGDDFGYDQPVYQYEAGFIVVDLLGGFSVPLPQNDANYFEALADAEQFLWDEWCSSEINGVGLGR